MHTISVAVLTLAFAPIAFSQGTDPVSRAAVKAETRSLEKSGKID
jgi:hypothetical protein